MIVRELGDGSALVISQESHADVAAQFAAHWGNDVFSQLEPYGSMVFGTIYHDSGHRDMEAILPVDPEKGLPYNFRGAPPGVRNRQSDVNNALWIRDRDAYAALVVSMHHSGLRKRRYDTLAMRRGDGAAPAEGPKLGADDAFQDLEGWQQEAVGQLGLANGSARETLWHNYQLLQAFDLLSLHLCCDGYQGARLQEAVLERVPLRPGGELVDLRLIPTGPDSTRIEPYPFDGPLQISAMGRCMAAGRGSPDEAVKDAYHQAVRRPLVWEITS